MIFAELDSRPDKGGGRGGKGIRAKDEKKFLQDFLQEHVDSGSFPNITVLICYLLTLLIPCSSVCCERGFSLQNLIKTASTTGTFRCEQRRPRTLHPESINAHIFEC